ncbi:hypothetical protein ASPVEDRAFT_372240 [Aspergillus versicolor CBS 583.65]|uniref:Uncharacterized protein n=1 Tax=Aspergillus versicolor CBS 583.65 TaxID=1036611 RepID=A0A1L9Q1L7_ASPVE|nr:uncharacterized protein ASPVEDRAFT_372240 [Aspergillus versicolor CBS 583.65]OJJ07663.1 hypothetical protein ASPVEDRAFT_372240 [Aspergillus versicolor CBS 583.65]
MHAGIIINECFRYPRALSASPSAMSLAKTAVRRPSVCLLVTIHFVSAAPVILRLVIYFKSTLLTKFSSGNVDEGDWGSAPGKLDNQYAGSKSFQSRH